MDEKLRKEMDAASNAWGDEEKNLFKEEFKELLEKFGKPDCVLLAGFGGVLPNDDGFYVIANDTRFIKGVTINVANMIAKMLTEMPELAAAVHYSIDNGLTVEDD